MKEFIESGGKTLDDELIPIKKTLTHTEIAKLLQEKNDDTDTTIKTNY